MMWRSGCYKAVMTLYIGVSTTAIMGAESSVQVLSSERLTDEFIDLLTK